MAESSSDGIQNRSDPELDKSDAPLPDPSVIARSHSHWIQIQNVPKIECDDFMSWLYKVLPPCYYDFCDNNRDVIREKFCSLRAGQRDWYLHLIRNNPSGFIGQFSWFLRWKYISLRSIFNALDKAAAKIHRHEIQSGPEFNMFMYFLEEFLPWEYKTSCDNNHDVIREVFLSLPAWECRWFLYMIYNNGSQFGKLFNCFLHPRSNFFFGRRDFSVHSIFSALYEAADGVASETSPHADHGAFSCPPIAFTLLHPYTSDIGIEHVEGGVASGITPYADPGASSSSTAAVRHAHNGTYCTLRSPYSSGGVASGIFPYPDPGTSSSSTAAVRHTHNGTYCTLRSPYSSGGAASGIFPYADPDASSSSTATVRLAYNGTYCTLRSPYSSDTGNRDNSPNHQREFTVLSNSFPDSATHIQSHSPWPAASLNNPPGHGRVSIIPTDGEFTSGHGTIVNSPGHQRAFNIVTSNSLPDHADHIQSSPRLAASLNDPPGHDREVIIQLDGTILAEAIRATRDDEAAGNAELFKILVPASLTVAYEARNILDSIYNGSLPFSIKTYGYLTVVLAGAAVLSSLVGLSLSTFKPKTLPFGGSPQRMMQIMHNVGVHGIAYGFIGTMCHRFLLDDPFTFWIVAGLASAVVMTLVTFTGRRR